MTEFLIRHFVKDSENVNTPGTRQQYGKLGSITGIATNLLLFASKFVVGTLSQSVSITADAVNNLSDAGSAVISLVSFRVAEKPADREHPFGHARIEYVASMVVAIFIILLGVELGKSSLEKIVSPQEATGGWVVILVLIGSILAKLWLYRFNRKLGKRIDSQLMEATAADSLSDVAATLAVLISTVVSPLLHFSLDGYMGVLVACFILRSGVGIVKDAMDKLLGEAPTRELVREIEDYVRSYEGVLGCHDLVIHNYGPNRCFASVHAEVPAARDILASHDIIDNIERDILRDKGIYLVIHLDPVVTGDAEVNRHREMARRVLEKISPALSFHDFRMVIGPTHTNLIFDVVAPFGFFLTDSQLKEQIGQALQEEEGTLFTVVTVDRPSAGVVDAQKPS